MYTPFSRWVGIHRHSTYLSFAGNQFSAMILDDDFFDCSGRKICRFSLAWQNLFFLARLLPAAYNIYYTVFSYRIQFVGKNCDLHFFRMWVNPHYFRIRSIFFILKNIWRICNTVAIMWCQVKTVKVVAVKNCSMKMIFFKNYATVGGGTFVVRYTIIP
jgi:hypothetical protein